MVLATVREGFSSIGRARLSGMRASVHAVTAPYLLFEAERVPHLPWAREVYRVLGEYPAASVGGLLRLIAQDDAWPQALRKRAQGHTFLIQCRQQEQMVSPDAALLRRVEEIVYREGLAVHRHEPRHRLLAWLPGDGRGYFLEEAARVPPEGPPTDLYHLLCLLAGIRREDRCADPFADRGELIRAMLYYRPASLYAAEADPEQAARLAAIRGLHVDAVDALASPGAGGNDDVIITMVPWERYEQALGPGYLHSVLALLAQRLAPGGRLVLLPPRMLPVEQAAEQNGLQMEIRVETRLGDRPVKALRFVRPAESDCR